ncbi:unnamed protein product [Clonostachys rosea]|uniref:Uncharacterized protein n=1 Tax=Bionectria ochroleuca TaxID=29856 RepID=A0ABY6V088_BIOOC|nr:unnamed protein product [Clonostachys rosea]
MAPKIRLSLGPSALPVYDTIDNHAKMYWAPTYDNYYDEGVLEGQIRVVSVDDYDFGLAFSGPVSIPRELGPLDGSARIVLQGHFQPEGKPLETTPCTEDIDITTGLVDYDAINVKLVGKFKAARQHLPWGMKGSIHWTLTFDMKPDSPIQLGQCAMELYFISTTNLGSHQILFRGLPVSFFRRFLLPLRLMTEDHDIKTFKDASLGRNIDDSERGWLEYVIDKLHYQPNMQYDDAWGDNFYYQGKTKPISFDHWVSDCDEQAKHKINCYDLAGLVWVIVPLGLSDSSHKLQMKYMDPFGYISKTDLIGWGPCNSPYSRTKVLGINDDAREGFRSHVFVTVTLDDGVERVLDATCRPFTSAHCGRETLEQYVESSIDDETELYGTKGKLKPGECDPPNNPKNWPGPDRLLTQPEVFAPGLINSPVTPDNVFGNVIQQFDGWAAQEPNFSVHSTHLGAQWFFSAENGEKMTLTISRCAATGLGRDNPVDSAYALWEVDIETIKRECIDVPGAPTTTDPAIKAVWSSKDGKGNLMVDKNHHWSAPPQCGKGAMLWMQGTFVVKLTKDTVAGIATYAQRIVDLIHQVDQNNESVSPLTADAIPDAVPVGRTFEINVSGLPEESVPINVDIQHAKVVYLSSSISGSTATFKFISREKTDLLPEKIVFSSWNRQMKISKSTEVEVHVIAQN